MLRAIYPGSFDPVTYGHIDIMRYFEYELQMSQTNQKLDPNIETMFLTTSIEYSYLSSTTVREIAAFGGDLTQFVPEAVALELEKKMNTKGECNK